MKRKWIIGCFVLLGGCCLQSPAKDKNSPAHNLQKGIIAITSLKA